MNIRDFKKALPFLFESQITPMVWGHHGIGKSQAVRQYCEESGIGFIDLRLGNMEVGDLLGLADFEVDDKGRNVATKFMRPAWLPVDPDSKGVLFLDEINRATRDVLQAVFQLVLDKRIHEYYLPESWDVVAAVNPNTSDYIVTDLGDAALLDRFCHVKLTPTVGEWISYGKSKNFSPEILNFIKDRPELLQHEQEDFSLIDDVKVMPSRRSWENMSKLMITGAPMKILKELGYGIVGHTATNAFISSLKNAAKPFTGNEILNGYGNIRSKVVEMAESESGGRLDILKACADNIGDELEKFDNKEFTETQKNNLITFILDVPSDLSYSFLRRVYMFSDEIREVIDNSEEIVKMLNTIRGKDEAKES